MEYIIIFFTSSGAIKFNKKMQSKKIQCELMPVPRKLSSNCGIGAKIVYDKELTNFIDDEVEKIYNYTNNKYELIYENIWYKRFLIFIDIVEFLNTIKHNIKILAKDSIY